MSDEFKKDELVFFDMAATIASWKKRAEAAEALAVIREEQLDGARKEVQRLQELVDAKQEVLWGMRRLAEQLGIPDGCPMNDSEFVRLKVRDMQRQETTLTEARKFAEEALAHLDPKYAMYEPALRLARLVLGRKPEE